MAKTRDKLFVEDHIGEKFLDSEIERLGLHGDVDFAKLMREHQAAMKKL